MARSTLTNLKSKLVKIKLTLLDLEYRKIGVNLAITILDNQLSSLGLALAEFGSKTKMDEFCEFMQTLAIVKMELSTEDINIDIAREKLLSLTKTGLFTYIA